MKFRDFILACRWNVDLLLAVRFLGFFGLAWVTANLLYMTLSLAPAMGMRIDAILNGEIPVDAERNGKDIAALTQETFDFGRYFIFMIFLGLNNCSLILASYVKRPWSILLWISFELTTLLWHYYFFLESAPRKYSPHAIDALSTVANLITATYIYFNLNSLVEKK